MDYKVRNELEILCMRLYGGVALIGLLHEALTANNFSADSYADAAYAVHDYMKGLVGEMNMIITIGCSA